MISYTVYYRHPLSPFWRKIRNVTGDVSGLLTPAGAFPMRVLFLADRTRIELPLSVVIKFSPGRFEVVRENMERDAGQKMETRGAIPRGRRK